MRKFVTSTPVGTQKPSIAAPVTTLTGLAKRGAARLKATRADFYEDLADALEDNAVLAGELSRRQRFLQADNKPFAALLGLWLRRMDTQPFSQAIRGTVPTMDSIILSAAESGGSLAQGLRYMATIVRDVEAMKKSLIGAIVVPMILFGMIIGMLVGYAVFLVPILESIMPVVQWPFLGQVMYAMSRVVVTHGLWVGPLMAGLLIWMVFSFGRWTGPRRSAFERRFVVYTVYRDYFSAIFLVSLAALMKSGTSLLESLSLIRSSSNPWLAWHINRIISLLDSNAGTPAVAFNTGLFSRDLYFRIYSYGERSSFPEALAKIGRQVVKRVGDSVRDRAKLLNMILLGISGVLLAAMVSSVMLTAQEAQRVIRTQR